MKISIMLKGLLPMKWLNSVRSISLLIFVIGINFGFLWGKVSEQLYMTAAMVSITGYFAKRNEEQK